MLRAPWTSLLLLVLGGITGCFQSEFVLYGPVCHKDKETACSRVVGDAQDGRACFRPDPESDVGYCALLCENSCETVDGRAPRCINRGDTVNVCALDCVDDNDCPDGMLCEDDPKGIENFKLCVPRP